jgi:hypothetical protein
MFFCTRVTPHAFTSGKKTGYPVLSFALYSVAPCTLLNFFPHTIWITYLLLDVILIIKQLKPNEYDNKQHMLFQYLMESSLN